MKKIWFGMLAMVMVLIAGCYTVDEEIAISENGAGTYVTKMDMSALIQMMQSMGAEDELSKNGLDHAIDTTIYLKNLIDTSSRATSEQKRLFKDGTMKLKMNLKESILKADVYFPFNSFADLQSLMSGASTSGLADAFKKVFSGQDSTQPAPPQDQSLDQINNVFDVTVTKNSIIRKLNDEKYKALMAKPEIEQAKQMMGTGLQVMYTTTIHLPRAVKKSESPFIALSDDKKTVTIKYDLLKLFETPEKFSYSITY
ncbi:MAG: hypothetical protein ABI415_00625 [Flavitalea sp.]